MDIYESEIWPSKFDDYEMETYRFYDFVKIYPSHQTSSKFINSITVWRFFYSLTIFLFTVWRTKFDDFMNIEEFSTCLIIVWYFKIHYKSNKKYLKKKNSYSNYRLYLTMRNESDMRHDLRNYSWRICRQIELLKFIYV